MLESVKISRRQSEIRQSLAGLVGKPTPDESEMRSIVDLDAEFQRNEVRLRGALIAEDTERRDAKRDLETRGGNEWDDLVGKFELRQVALALDEGRTLSGATNEVVSELRSKGGYRGVPVPWGALEMRTGETIASGVVKPITKAPIIDRIFAASVAGRMGANFINIDTGERDYPVATAGCTAAWAATETGAVGSPAAYQTTDRPLKPNQTLGVQMKLTRNALKQAGDAVEQAVRRDMNGAMGIAIDQAVFLGTGASGQPAGVLIGSYSIASTAVGAAATWSAFRAAVQAFMIANAATSPGDVKLLIRPEVWNKMDGTLLTNTGVSEWDRMVNNIGLENIVGSSNALATPTGAPLACTALLATNVGGVPPIFVGAWGSIDMIRDPYSDATSGGLRLTALATLDVTVSRPAQLQILTGVQV
ncbi:phage major capsid protein [Methylocystis bryophila]|uniref:Major capsid protein n=1 Tax=Methylocystis bryophila TaxID=655015 RepID=A0A1W6MTS9_9HYPH|nr:phage major capsid protein [Methylocystis bryophila]ARN80926.1 major capsid protein [Methylocystis bryophila]BDV36826.1 major capsid protein [Methylocystis bryophila]